MFPQGLIFRMGASHTSLHRLSRYLANFSGARVPRTIARRMAQPGDAGDVAEDFRQLQVHLLQGLLHVLHVPAGRAN